MDPQLLTVILLLIGVALIFAEFFVPSGGIIAVACALCFLGSIFSAHKAWGTSHPTVFWTYVASLFIIIPGSIYGAFQILLRTPLGNHVFLPIPKPEDVMPHQREVSRLQTYIGKRGRAQSLMTPGGMVIVEGTRLHALADSIMIQPNAEIEVIGIQGTVVVVRPVDHLKVPPVLPIPESNVPPPDVENPPTDELNPFT